VNLCSSNCTSDSFLNHQQHCVTVNSVTVNTNLGLQRELYGKLFPPGLTQDAFDLWAARSNQGSTAVPILPNNIAWGELQRISLE